MHGSICGTWALYPSGVAYPILVGDSSADTILYHIVVFPRRGVRALWTDVLCRLFLAELLCIAVAGCLVADRSTCASCRDVTQGVPHIAGVVAPVPPAIVAVVAGLYRVGLPVLAHQDSSLSLYHATWHVDFSVLSMPLA